MEHQKHGGAHRSTKGGIFSGELPSNEYLTTFMHTEGLDVNLTSPSVIKIPYSLVVTAAAFREFMRKNRLDEVVEGLLATVNVKRMEEVLAPAAQIKEIISSSPLPGHLYERILEGCREIGHGVTVVWPVTMPVELFHCSKEYQKFPYLEVTGAEETIKAVRRWWASLFEPAAIFYRELSGQRHQDARITVAAQRSTASASNGVL